MKPYYCYIVRCRDDSLYTGITNDVERRIAVHNKGKGGAYTASRCPVELVYSECIGSKGDALRRELEIKALTRSQKLSLIETGGSGPTVSGRERNNNWKIRFFIQDLFVWQDARMSESPA